MSNKTRKLIASFILLGGLALSACSKPEDKIVGTWAFDTDATIAGDERLKAMPEDQRKMATEMAQKMFQDASFEFSKDGKMTMNAAGKKEEATYSVKSAEGNKVVLNAKGKDGKDEEITVDTSAGDKLVLSMKDQKIYLKKK